MAVAATWRLFALADVAKNPQTSQVNWGSADMNRYLHVGRKRANNTISRTYLERRLLVV
jgi:hypothetical protein